MWGVESMASTRTACSKRKLLALAAGPIGPYRAAASARVDADAVLEVFRVCAPCANIASCRPIARQTITVAYSPRTLARIAKAVDPVGARKWRTAFPPVIAGGV